MRLTFSSLYSFLPFSSLSLTYLPSLLAFSVLVLICFVLVPEPTVLSSEFVSETSSVAFFAIPPAFSFVSPFVA